MPGPGQPKGPFYLAVAAVIIALLSVSVYRSCSRSTPPEAAQKTPVRSDAPKGAEPAAVKVEAPDNSIGLTAKEYVVRRPAPLPEVKGTSAYKPMENNTVRFALNVWAGWAPIILANNGFKADKAWKTPDGKDFRVELVLIDNPVAMLSAYAAGEVHIGWGTLDMVPLFVDGMVEKTGRPRDSRVMPRIFQQIDWSNGGDGIVVRESIKTVADLRDKKLVLAQNSPSQYFALNMLVAAGVQPSEVNLVYTDDAFQAAAAFHADKSLSGAVSWSPDIYKLAEVRGNRMLVTSQTANKLIADVWFSRADFARDNPAIIEGLVRGIFDAMEELKKPDRKAACAKLMASGYNVPGEDALKMFEDAHNTNWAENHQFFVNQSNPTNFERVWQQSYRLYRQIGTIQNPAVRFDQVMDMSIIQKLGNEEKYKSQRDEYQIQLTPKTVGEIRVELPEILTNTVVIRFFPNDWDLHKKITRKTPDGKEVEQLYDPAVDSVLEGIAQLVGKFGAARVIIEGHTDGSMRGQVPSALVKELSMNRANAVKEALIAKYNLDPMRLQVDGVGWERPADPREPLNHAKNRRVEVKVYPAERQ